ncbi:CBS domain-containing protein [Ancylobacter sp. 6x-1]|uniref:CBS domain-containing protein n=1 Tax=Ancylobacter crimeensis TaxID=2579147 RepID=A0ABT0DFC8_9HYPH|nr:CBS domain-containing protein [Ancylobacter crimeensis]MCK0198579.1 CBS domain-containing protein [Ancylobacter crimeensis]
MTVRSIIDAKGHDVLTIVPETPLREAARLLGEHRIGAIVVVDAMRRVVGILSERDVVRVVGLDGPARLDDPVEQVMTRKVVTCSGNDTVQEIMGTMTAGRFRHIPVVENARLVGIISIGDVVKHRVAEMERESHALREYILTA